MIEKLLQAGTKVYVSGKPGKIGVTTGRNTTAGLKTLIQVEFGPAERVNKLSHLLVIVEEEIFDDPIALFKARRFGTPFDLRKILIYNKIKGDLTNIFYSMELGDTTFYSHQFKPVLKFIESHAGRLLIADEVGLGKTIEAIYIWKELQARQSAKRLLIVCPAMLREKWKGELKSRFGLRSSIVKAKDIYNELVELKEINDHNRAFIHISSLEGIRTPSDYQVDPQRNYRTRLGDLLYNHSPVDELPLYDLVVFDEAHYLRNQTTASNRFAQLIRDVSENLLFLTATPIQTSSKNLFQLMKLIDPDQFYEYETFTQQVDINTPFIQIANILRRNKIDVSELQKHFLELERSSMSEHKLLFEYIKKHFPIYDIEKIVNSPDMKMELCRFIESNQLLNRYMNRTRKRDVIENRVIREANAYPVNYSDYEKQIYQHLSLAFMRKAEQTTGIPLFVLITRQRQMASSLVAAIEGWQTSGLFEELQEFFWEDQGIESELERHVIETEFDNLMPPINFSDIDLDILKAQDSKYNDLLKAIHNVTEIFPDEKIIVFAYFRKTLVYLEERLRSDNLHTFRIQGGMGEEKYDIIDRFKHYNKQAVLLSSEVGSEGIDLQFCRILVNYDLPWNPMRVEQRIGRIDRLGQKADRINIINFTNAQTIEDRILERLYERVEVFKRSIGDLEEIIGELQSELMNIVYNPQLSEAEREAQALQTMQAQLENKVVEQHLEDNAVNLLGFSDYLINTINESKDTKRWIDGSDLIVFIEDFFKENFVETRIEKDINSQFGRKILLSRHAKVSLNEFIKKNKPYTRTSLYTHPNPKLCIFDQKISHLQGVLPIGSEFVDTTHPLIMWIKNHYQSKEKLFYPVSAFLLSQKYFQTLSEGIYVYAIHKWEFSGLTQRSILRFSAMSLDGSYTLDSNEAEQVINKAVLIGKIIKNSDYYIKDPESLNNMIEEIKQSLMDDFGQYYMQIETENELFYERQRESALKLYNRKIDGYNTRIKDLEDSNDLKKMQIIRAIEGSKSKEEHILDSKIRMIELRKSIDATPLELSYGFLVVKKD